MQWILVVTTILAGAGLSFEAGLLGPLGKQVGTLWATFSIFGIGTALTFFLMLFFGKRQSPSFFSLPAWQLTGGLLGPIYVVILTLATPFIGVSMTMFGVLVGQIAQGLLNDHYALFGSKHHQLNRYRVIALIFIILALGLTLLGDLS